MRGKKYRGNERKREEGGEREREGGRGQRE